MPVILRNLIASVTEYMNFVTLFGQSEGKYLFATRKEDVERQLRFTVLGDKMTVRVMNE